MTMNPAAHTHFCAQRAPLTRSSMWLTNQVKTLPLFADAAVVLGCDGSNAERHGAQGARQWVARKA